MQTEIRQIVPVSTAGLVPGKPPTGMPICELVEPAMLYVDPAYQRDIGERGMRQIRRVIERFDWAKFKPPICSYAEFEGATVLKVLDGQHTAIAAASNPFIDKIPVMIVETEGTAAEARAFIGQNAERVGVTPLQLHYAALAAGDEDARTLQEVCDKAGITILKRPGAYDPAASRETIAVGAIKQLIARRGDKLSKEILEVLANAERGPVKSDHIKAVEYLMTDPDHRDAFWPQDLTTAIVELLTAAEEEAEQLAMSKRWSMWKALAIVWFRRCKKRRQTLSRVA
ncbi:hypothetical protein CPT32_12970 [Rhizobium sophoriradicis]|uniref:DUF6551 family protein n=1 Tax=Rhizobium sophoriradicis TaxID=1535245 RepID=UPI000BBD5310|nr:DUF6551 family protein [Rhizobium sophoriradicis]PCK86327.1 hypothetical protein CPT32_12970 [Rhizobium sophoriradicis]